MKGRNLRQNREFAAIAITEEINRIAAHAMGISIKAFFMGVSLRVIDRINDPIKGFDKFRCLAEK
jgi:hypothetical protein